jgi:hypothetical protein
VSSGRAAWFVTEPQGADSLWRSCTALLDGCPYRSTAACLDRPQSPQWANPAANARAAAASTAKTRRAALGSDGAWHGMAWHGMAHQSPFQ